MNFRVASEIFGTWPVLTRSEVSVKKTLAFACELLTTIALESISVTQLVLVFLNFVIKELRLFIMPGFLAFAL